MIIVFELTEDQKNQLLKQKYCENMRFNPIQDNEGRWVISQPEVVHCDNPKFPWVKKLPAIEWVKPIEEEAK